MNIQVGDILQNINKKRILLRGFIRCRVWRLCPKCNSDAPEKDDCNICNNFYGYADRDRTFHWWFLFKRELHGKYKSR